MLRIYDLRKDLNKNEVLVIHSYRMRGEQPLVLKYWTKSSRVEIIPQWFHSQVFIFDELKRLYALMDNPHWRALVCSLCMQGNADTGLSSIFEANGL